MDDLNRYLDNPVQYLNNLMTLPPSRDGLVRLGGHVAAAAASSSKNQHGSNNNSSATIAAAYLHAAARHLPVVGPLSSPVAAAAGATSSGGNTNKADVEAEMKNSQLIHQVVEAVGHAVTQVQPRSCIAQSGILPVLASIITPPPPSSATTTLVVLQPTHVEFLQACIYAEHYAYAERMVGSTWPRPNATMSVRNVLRYFYLRGIVHLGCHHEALALRCFRTCLVIPAEAVSAISLAAWKKLMLVQCLVQSDAALDQTKPMMHLPNPTSPCVVRFINNAMEQHKAAAAAAANNNNNPSGSTPESAAADATDDASSAIVHLVDNLETGESSSASSSREKNTKYPSMGVAAYATLVQAFVDMDKHVFQAQLAEHQALLMQDGNWGLARQVQSELPCRQLYAWSKVYSCIPLHELAQLLALDIPEMERLLVQVSLAKQWPIQVDGHMVTFPVMEPLLHVGSTTATTSHPTEELVGLTKLVQKINVTLSASSKFLSLARKESLAESNKATPSGPRGVEEI